MEADPFQTRGGTFAGDGPLKERARASRSRHGPWFHVASIGILVLIPWGIFLVTLVTMACVALSHPLVALVLLLLCACACGLMALLHLRNARGPIYLAVAVLGLTAMAVGSGVGCWIGGRFFEPHSLTGDRVAYKGVSPNQPAAAHSDAGTMEFTASAFVDTHRALGWEGTDWDTYCVAPIADEAGLRSSAEFWAVGTNCCEFQFTCGDVRNPSARGGLVSRVASEHHKFHEAVKMASARFHIIIPEEPMFVRWSSDPRSLRTKYLRDGILSLFVALLVYLVVSVMVGGVLHESAGRSKY